MEKKLKCPICDTEAVYSPDPGRDLVFYSCPVCGRFQLGVFEKLDRNHLASYLFYNRFRPELFEFRYHTVLDKETCDKYREDFDSGNNTHGRPVHMDTDIVENWYPKTFSERVDRILLFLNSKIKHIGQQITLSYQELLSVLFVDRKELDSNGFWIDRNPDDCEHESKYMLDYLVKSSYIEYTDGPSEEEWIDILCSTFWCEN